MKKHILLVIILFPFSLNAQLVKVQIKNPTALPRTAETVEISWKSIADRLHLKGNTAIIVVDEIGKEYPSQVLLEGCKTPQKIIFQVDIAAKKTLSVMLKSNIHQVYETKTFGRFVPERKDDYAWENDRVAFRIYGPALIKTDGPSNGIDVWCKRSEKMIINERYEKELSGKGSYHTDWGNGLDLYKVGRTLGAGAMAPFVNDSLWLASNFATQETLDNGPIRTTFRLTYDASNVNGQNITEIRTISIDAGSQFSKIVEQYQNVRSTIPVAAGIVKRNGSDSAAFDAKNGYAIYFEPPTPKDGSLNLAIVSLKGWKSTKVAKGHILATTDYSPNTKLTYYTGYGWSKWGFPTRLSWFKYVNDFAKKSASPLVVIIK